MVPDNVLCLARSRLILRSGDGGALTEPTLVVSLIWIGSGAAPSVALKTNKEMCGGRVAVLLLILASLLGFCLLHYAWNKERSTNDIVSQLQQRGMGGEKWRFLRCCMHIYIYIYTISLFVVRRLKMRVSLSFGDAVIIAARTVELLERGAFVIHESVLFYPAGSLCIV